MVAALSIRIVMWSLLFPLSVARVAAQCPHRETSAELFAGSAWSAPTPLTVELTSNRTRLTAHYGTRPFKDAPYYGYRVGVAGEDGRAVELEMVHHKIYLENPVSPIERFEVTHGYNLPTVNVSAPAGEWRARVGVGLVVAHPEGVVGGRDIASLPTRLGGGYHVAGVTTQFALGRRYPLNGGATVLTAAPEVKLTASWASIRIPEGRIIVPNVALHLLGGLGVRRCS